MLYRPLDDQAFRTLAALRAAEEGFYTQLSQPSLERATAEGWVTRHGLLTELGHALFLAEEGRRSTSAEQAANDGHSANRAS